MGAKLEGNADGSIPAWTPVSAPVQGKSAGYPRNPDIDDDPILFTITVHNMADHLDALTEGHKRLLQNYPDSYSMPVYPSHRLATFPQHILEKTVLNDAQASLNEAGELTDAALGFPFPRPENGAEAIWNHRVRYRGGDLMREYSELLVQPDGAFKWSQLFEERAGIYGNPQREPSLAQGESLTEIWRLALTVMEPVLTAGNVILMHEYAATIDRGVWAYNPGIRRVRRVPSAAYDDPFQGTDGAQFTDEREMFMGALDRFDWSLVGKREIYVPYNANRLGGAEVAPADVVRAGHLAPELTRYERHRVWVVDAINRPETAHTFSKRRFYLDEDTWQVLAVDNYNRRDELYHFQEGHLVTDYELLIHTAQPEVVYDVQSGRYFVTSLITAEDSAYTAVVPSYADDYFEPTALADRVSGSE